MNAPFCSLDSAAIAADIRHAAFDLLCSAAAKVRWRSQGKPGWSEESTTRELAPIWVSPVATALRQT